MTLLLALALEWVFGDPENRWHPVAWFGRWANDCEALMYCPNRIRGGLVWGVVVAVPMLLLTLGHYFFGWIFDVLLLWSCIGWKSLFEHVRLVLTASSDEQARHAVSNIVSRDTATMSRADARRAALESLAENASDAVLAPLFWFLLFGPLGAVFYRMVNTLDAMWGYRNERYEMFGWCAAKTDDVMNYLPARITARLMLWVGPSARWDGVKKQAASHASPNAGWPEVALAYAGNVQLGGEITRYGKREERPIYGRACSRQLDDDNAVADAVAVVKHALILAVCLALGVLLVF